MCNLSSAIEKKGIALGRSEGRSEGVGLGKFELASKYYRNGRITGEEAASDLNMPLSEFLDKIKEGNGQCTV